MRTLDRSSRRLQGKCQGLLRYARYKRPNQPSQTRRNISRQRNRLALHVDSAVALFHAPPRFHAPQETAVLAGRLLTLIGLSRVFHFRDAHRRAAAMLSLLRFV